ncbi:hypothetical protein GW17_00056839 [Ensete ventricosum]|nr:hypothetical protein GW17_00056839 [Ensete ventricosum]
MTGEHRWGKAMANAVAVAMTLLMIAVAFDCLVTRLYLGAGRSLHVVPLAHGTVAGNPVLVLALPCVVLAVAYFIGEGGGLAPRARDVGGGRGNGKGDGDVVVDYTGAMSALADMVEVRVADEGERSRGCRKVRVQMQQMSPVEVAKDDKGKSM